MKFHFQKKLEAFKSLALAMVVLVIVGRLVIEPDRNSTVSDDSNLSNVSNLSEVQVPNDQTEKNASLGLSLQLLIANGIELVRVLNDSEIEKQCKIREIFEKQKLLLEKEVIKRQEEMCYIEDISYSNRIKMAKVVWVEARGEEFEGQVAVAAVMINRLRSKKYGENIEKVIFKKGAFASIKNVSKKQAMSCMEAVEAALKGEDPTKEMFENGALFFYDPKGIKTRELAKRKKVKKLVIGGHIFHDTL